MKGEVKYIGFFGGRGSDPDRYSAMSAVSKMEYVARKINECGFDVRIVSPSWLHERSQKLFAPGMTLSLKRGVTAVFFPGMRTRNGLTRNLSRFLARFFLFVYIMLFVKKGEKILVYHSQAIAGPLWLARVLKKFEIILELEEIYGRVWGGLSDDLKGELRVIGVANSFLCVNDNLAEFVRQFGRPAIVLYGAYSVVLDEQRGDGRRTNRNGVIRLVYAGSVEGHRSGALLATEAMEYLDSGYQLSIIGTGDRPSIEKLIDRIEALNLKQGRIACRYYEPLSGQEFADFLHEHDVGLNPQLTGGYMTTAFPSKIVSYLSHGLRVVSTPVEAVQKSKIAELVQFSVDDSPSRMAVAIRQLDFRAFSPREVLERIETEFANSLCGLLETRLEHD